jgi:hypothetical protein
MEARRYYTPKVSVNQAIVKVDRVGLLKSIANRRPHGGSAVPVFNLTAETSVALIELLTVTALRKPVAP